MDSKKTAVTATSVHEEDDDDILPAKAEPPDSRFQKVLDGKGFDTIPENVLLSQIYVLRSANERIPEERLFPTVNLLLRDDVPQSAIPALLEVAIFAVLSRRSGGRAEIGVPSVVDFVAEYIGRELQRGRRVDYALVEKALFCLECSRTGSELDRGTSLAGLLKAGPCICALLEHAIQTRGISADFQLRLLSAAEIFLDGIDGWSYSGLKQIVLSGAVGVRTPRIRSKNDLKEFLRPKTKSSGRMKARLADALERLQVMIRLSRRALSADMRPHRRRA